MKTQNTLLYITTSLLLCLLMACAVDSGSQQTEIPRMPDKAPVERVAKKVSKQAEQVKEGIVDHAEQLYTNLLAKAKAFQTEGANSVEEVEQLKAELQNLEAQNAEYKGRSEDLMEELDEMIGEWREQTQKYVLIGSKKDLKKGDVLKGRFLKKPALEQRFDNARFDEIPMTKTTIEADKKIKNIFPERQQNYYEIKDEQLVIKDPENFWKVSNYLIVQTKNK